MKIYINDVRRFGYCVRGIKKFCAMHNIDFKNFVKNGIDIAEIEDIDDAMLNKLIAKLKQIEGE